MDERQTKSSLTTENRMCNILSLTNQSMMEVRNHMKNQYLSRSNVQKYLAAYPDITKEEKKELLAWIKAGQSPYNNDRCVFDESDHPLDFIGAIRAEKEYCEEQWRLRRVCEQ